MLLTVPTKHPDSAPTMKFSEMIEQIFVSHQRHVLFTRDTRHFESVIIIWEFRVYSQTNDFSDRIKPLQPDTRSPG